MRFFFFSDVGCHVMKSGWSRIPIPQRVYAIFFLRYTRDTMFPTIPGGSPPPAYAPLFLDTPVVQSYPTNGKYPPHQLLLMPVVLNHHLVFQFLILRFGILVIHRVLHYEMCQKTIFKGIIVQKRYLNPSQLQSQSQLLWRFTRILSHDNQHQKKKKKCTWQAFRNLL